MENKEQLIDDYLLSRLSMEERKQFETALENDKALAKEVQEMQQVLIDIARYGETIYIEQLNEVEEQLDREGFFMDNEEKELLIGIEQAGKEDDFLKQLLAEEEQLTSEKFFEKEATSQNNTIKEQPIQQSKIVPMWKKAMSIAAAILVLISAVYLLSSPDELSRSALAQEGALTELKSYDGTIRGGTPADLLIEKEWEKALQQYQAENVTEALAFFQNTDRNTIPESERTAFIYNQAVLETINGNYQTADELYQRIAQKNPGEVAYQRAILQIYMGADKAQLKAAFTEIASSILYSKKIKVKATEMLEKIELMEE